MGTKPSPLGEDILRRFVNDEGKHGEHGKHPILEGVQDLHHLTVEICVDGVISPIERQRFTKRATRLLSDLWNEEHHEEEVAS